MSRALRGINMASSHKAKAPPLTHFLCIPLVTPASRPQLSQSIASFREDVTRPKALGGFELPLDAVRPVGTLHLTLGIMSFPKDEGLDRAVELLQSLKLRDIMSTVKAPVMPGSTREETTKAQPQQPLINLKGLHTFQKAEKATVLFAAPSDQAGMLQGFAEKVKALFKEAGLLTPDDRPLLLHATIVNTIYVKGNRNSSHGKKRGDRAFVADGQAILDRYEDQVWLEDAPLEKIAICRMSAKPVEENGVVVDAAYEVEAEVEY